MVSARGALRTEGFAYALDNGAWTAHVRGEPFDVSAFERALDPLGADADFVVAPDIVAGGLASLRLSESWLARLDTARRVLVPVQDGVTPADIAGLVSDRIGVFVGGSTEWKLRKLATWGRWCRERGVWCHVGRVNTGRRIAACEAAGITSFDGSSASRYAVNARRLEAHRRQRAFLW